MTKPLVALHLQIVPHWETDGQTQPRESTKNWVHLKVPKKGAPQRIFIGGGKGIGPRTTYRLDTKVLYKNIHT